MQDPKSEFRDITVVTPRQSEPSAFTKDSKEVRYLIEGIKQKIPVTYLQEALINSGRSDEQVTGAIGFMRSTLKTLSGKEGPELEAVYEEAGFPQVYSDITIGTTSTSDEEAAPVIEEAAPTIAPEPAREQGIIGRGRRKQLDRIARTKAEAEANAETDAITGEIMSREEADVTRREKEDLIQKTARANERLSIDRVERRLQTVKNPRNFDISMMAALSDNVNSNVSLKDTLQSFIDDPVAKINLEDNADQVASGIAATLSRYTGYETRINADGNVELQMPPYNEWREATPNILDQIAPTLFANGLEITAAVGAGMQAFKRMPGNLYVKGAASLGASALAAGAGRGMDILKNSLILNEDINKRIIVDQMINAGIWDMFGGILGTAVTRLPPAALRAAKGVFDKGLQGNWEGAQEILSRKLHLSKEKSAELVRGMRNTQGMQATQYGAATDTNLDEVLDTLSIIKTQPGGERIVQLAMQQGDILADQIAKEVNARAQDFLVASSKDAPADLKSTITTKLTDYGNTAFDMFGKVARQASMPIDKTQYRFDYDKLALNTLDKNQKKIIRHDADRSSVERVLALAGKRGGLEEDPTKLVPADKTAFQKYSSGNINPLKPAMRPTLRTFSNLLELRREINQLWGKSKELKAVKRNIDNEIERVVKIHLPDGKDWLKSWEEVNTQWGKYKDLEKNEIYKTAMDRTKDKTDMVDYLIDRAGSTQASSDLTKEFLSALPKETARATEMGMLYRMFDLYAVGKFGEMRAMNFPVFVDKANSMTFFTKDARQLKRAAIEYANIFKIDAQLGKVSGRINVSPEQTYLSSSPQGRLKMMMTNAYFNWLGKFRSTDSAKTTALAVKMSKVLNEPMKHKNVQAVLKSLPDDPELADAIKQRQIEFVKANEKDLAPKVPVYSKEVNYLKERDGPFGVGMYMSTEKAGSKNMVGLDPNRIAGTPLLRELLGIPTGEIKPQMIKGNIELFEALRRRDMDGVTLGKEVFIY